MTTLRSWLPLAFMVCSLAFPLGCKKSQSTEHPTETHAAAPATTAPEHEQVAFFWESDDSGVSGTMTTTLPDGEVFAGPFYEVSSETSPETLGGLHETWYGPQWRSDEAWPQHPSPQEFLTYYTGRVVAVLSGEDGTNMRCHFTLDDGARGMAGGGHGECQLSNGQAIAAMFAGP